MVWISSPHTEIPVELILRRSQRDPAQCQHQPAALGQSVTLCFPELDRTPGCPEQDGHEHHFSKKYNPQVSS
jgi:hypothetical protein